MKPKDQTRPLYPNPYLASPGFFLFIVCLLSGSPSISFALDRTIALTNGCAPPGNQAQIQIRLSDVNGIAGCDLEIAFDPDLISILDLDTTPLTQDFFLSHWTSTPGQLRISMASSEGLPATGPGAIALITVELSSSSVPSARTTLWFREARWYTELSVRQNPFGDNAIFQAGSVIPTEDGGIVFSLDSPHGLPGGSVTTSLRISLPVGVARIEGFLAFDANTLLFPSLSLAPSLSGWSKEVQYGVGQIHFILTGPTELSGADPIQIVSCTWDLSQEVVPGSEIVIATSNPQSKNQQDFRYVSLNQSGRVLVDGPVPTPTPGPLLVKDWNSY
jgi:hypothetical protein